MIPSQSLQVLQKLLSAELASGILGLRLLIACVCVATFMMGVVWTLGDGLSNTLERSGTTFLGGDLAATTTNVPLPENVRQRLAALGDLAEVAELRASAGVGSQRKAVELKGVDRSYPLYGSVALDSGRDIRSVLQSSGDLPAAIVEPSLLVQTGADVGDVLSLGDRDFKIADVLVREPDRLSAGRFLVGPRVLVSMDALAETGLLQLGSLVDYRYRLRYADETPSRVLETVQGLRPDAGWELETPEDAGDRVLRVVNRTATFAGIAGIVSFAIGLSGAFGAMQSWLRKRSRTLALYRLSGATPHMVLALHASIIALASLIGVTLGLVLGGFVATALVGILAGALHADWSAADIVSQMLVVLGILGVGLAGTAYLALSGAWRIAPGAAMRSGDAPMISSPRHLAFGSATIAAAVLAASFSLPIPALAGLTTAGLLGVVAILAGAAAIVSKRFERSKPNSFLGALVCRNLGDRGPTLTRTVTVGIGIVGITAVVATQNSFNAALQSELPARAPDLVLIDVQPDQVTDLRDRIAEDPDLGGLQANPFMRMTILAVNGRPAEDALVRADKSWVIEGDRSFSWTAEPTGAELLSGTWWRPDHDGAPLISPEEDVMEAFDLQVGDTVTYGVMGRTFTSEVANIRKEYHRTMRPEFLMVASPEPFRNAPHTWIMSLQGSNDVAIDRFSQRLQQDFPNVTSIDIRRLVEQLNEVVRAATLATVSIALLLIVAGTLSMAALAASDVNARQRDALVLTLIGTSRREIALTRLAEAGASGVVAALIGGASGLVIGYVFVVQGLRIDWTPGIAAFLMPVFLGCSAALAASLAGGLGLSGLGRGQLIRQLSS
jgi:putative ABC transport system permease protein